MDGTLRRSEDPLSFLNDVKYTLSESYLEPDPMDWEASNFGEDGA
jgi:hypothetical protein